MKRFLSVSLALGALAVAPAALADQAPITAVDGTQVDTIHLRSGGLYRGRASEIVPGDHVTVTLQSGETKIVPWAEVDRVIVASTPIPPPPTEARPPLKVSTAMQGPLATVHLKSSGKTFLYRRPQGSTEFVTACESPCGVDLPIGDTYKIGGSGIATTKEFRLEAAPGGAVTLDVDGPNWFGIVGGGTLTLAGGVLAYVGVIFALAGGATDATCNYCSDTKEVRNVGLGLMAIGAAGIAGGLLIVFPSLKTDISQDAAAPKREPKQDAFVRTPTWHTAGIEGGAPTPTFPAIFSRSF